VTSSRPRRVAIIATALEDLRGIARLRRTQALVLAPVG